MEKNIKILVFLIFFACSTKEDYIPLVNVNEQIDLNLPEFIQLKTPGATMFIEGGVKGIVVFNSGANNYKAYDRNCSYKPSLECSIIDSVNSSFVLCSCCGSAFLLDQDGTAVNSPAIIGLRQYECNLDLNTNILYITTKY